MPALAEAFVRLRVDSSQVAADTSKGIKEGAATGDAESAGENAGSKFSNGFNKAFKVAAVAGLAIAAIGAASIKMGVDFQSSMAKIQTQAGGSAADVKTLSAAVLNLAPSTQQGPIQLANALFHLKSVGLDNVDAMKALKVASDLAAVGGANLEETTNAIAAAWRSGIKGATNFGQAAATVNAIIGAGNMRMQDFVTAMGTGILSAANTFGVSMRQVGGALALMTDEGVPAVDAATRLKMSFSLLGAPSAAASKQLAKIGVTGFQLAQTMRSPGGLVSTIALLKQHLGEYFDLATKAGKSNAAILLSHAFGGGRSSSAILTMINNLDTLRKKQDQITQGISKYGPAVAAQRQTAEAQLHILESSVQTIGVRIGTALLPPVTRFVHFLASDVIPAVVRLGGILGPVLKNPAVLAFAGGLLAAVLAIKGIITAVKIWTAAQLLLDAALDANPIGIVIVAVAALAAGIAILWERSAAFRNIVEGAFRGMLTAAKAVLGWLKSNWPLLLGILLGPIGIAAALIIKQWSRIWNTLIAPVIRAFEAVKNAITGGFDSWWAGHGKELEQFWSESWHRMMAVFHAIWDPIVAYFKFGWNNLVSIVRPAVALITEIVKIAWGWISAITRATWDVIGGVVKAAWAVISGIIKIAVGFITTTIKIGWDLIVGIFNVALDLLTGHWGKAWDDIKNVATQVGNAVRGFLAQVWADIKSTAIAAWNGLIGGVKSAGADLIGYVKRIPGMILAALGDVGHLLWNAGVSIIRGLIGGITSMIGSIGHAIGGIASTIKSFLPFSPAKQGPLSGAGDPYYSGLSIGSKIAAGIAASLPALKKAIGGSVGEINSALTKAATEKALGNTSLGSLTSHKNALQGERAKEDAEIKKLEADRKAEYAADRKGSVALRAEQEKQIKTLQKLRAAQETQVKQTEAVIKNLRGEMTKLTGETKKLQAELAKLAKAATKAATSSSSSSSGSSSSSSSGSSGTAPAGPDWAGFSQWLAETGGTSGTAGWQENPGPLGGFGLGLGLPGPGVAGRFGGRLGGTGDGDPLMPLLLGKIDDLIEVGREQPGRTAAGLNAAMNGVVSHAMVKGAW